MTRSEHAANIQLAVAAAAPVLAPIIIRFA